MNRFKILAVLVGILVFAEGSGLIYFAHKAQKQARRLEALSQDLQSVEPGREKATKEKREFEGKYKNLLTEYEALKKDRDNVLVQTKRLLQEKRSSEGLEESVAELEEEKQLLEAANEEVLDQNEELQAKIEELEIEQSALEEERDEFEELYEKAQAGTAITELRNKASVLEKANKEIVSTWTNEYKTLKDEFRQATKEVGKLKENKDKAEAKVEELSEELAALKKDAFGPA